jgi:hypothetical protein
MTFLVSSLLTFAQENIEFQYTMKRDSVDSSLIRIEAKIINRANEKIYFLSESCNGLDYYLKTNVSNIEPYIMIHCNASYPRKIKINPRSEYIFHSLIRDEKELKEIGLTLTFVQLNSTTKVEGRSINEIKKEYLNQTLNLKGKMVELK